LTAHGKLGLEAGFRNPLFLPPTLAGRWRLDQTERGNSGYEKSARPIMADFSARDGWDE